MTFETLKRSHLKRNILIAIGIVLILTAVTLTFTRAKYRTTQSIPLIQGTINFSPSDFNMVAVYLNKGSETVSADKVPHVGYTLNEEESTCESPDGVEDSIGIEYIQPSLTFSNVIKKGTKCSVYFDLIPDSEKPMIDKVNYLTSNNSITLQVIASDNIGIFDYYYSVDNNEYIRSENNTFIIENLNVDQNYDINVYVEDAAGNKSELWESNILVQEFTPAYNVIEYAYNNNQSMLIYDGTSNNNLRYYGSNPNNYVYFNCNDYNNPSSTTCELWRVIGIFDQNTHGISNTKMVKLVRNDSLGAMYWNNQVDNSWRSSTLNQTLNNDYLNRTGNYSNNGLNEETNNMIENAYWKVGSISKASANVWSYYSNERALSMWNGKVALIYPSDYGFATGGGSEERSTCLNRNLSTWDHTDCATDNWIFDSSGLWTSISYTFNSRNYRVLAILGLGRVDGNTVALTNYQVYPTVYLKSDIIITSGDGSIDNPYHIKNPNF